MTTAKRSITMDLDGHEVKVTSPDKVMYPETGTTKHEVIDYLLAVAEVMLPRLRDRVVTVSASPGTGKDARQVRYPVVGGRAGLVWMANQAALEPHVPQRRVGPRGGIGKPDQIVARSGKDERAGKVFIDWSQNHPARSTVVPYSLRGLERPTVAAPRTWDEIEPGLTQLSPAEVLDRLEREGDLLAANGWPG